eukprot:gene26536-biopygen16792
MQYTAHAEEANKENSASADVVAPDTLAMEQTLNADEE